MVKREYAIGAAGEQEKFIDIKKVIRQKNPRLLAALPRFVISYLKKILHEDEINAFICKHGHRYDFDFVKAILEEFGANIRSVGLENIPLHEGCIIASNHPLGGLDAMALLNEVGKARQDVKFIVNDVLMNLKNLNLLFLPVNKHGRNPPELVRKLDEQYASGKVSLIFPAGLVSRRRKGQIRDLQWKKSFVTNARKHRKKIIPVYIQGRNSGFFYWLANIRKILGIKANIEMFYLVNEMYRQHDKTITLIFGPPVEYWQLDEKHSDHYWAEKIKEHVYKMGAKGKPLPF